MFQNRGTMKNHGLFIFVFARITVSIMRETEAFNNY